LEYEGEKRIPAGTVVDGKYRVESLIGRGGMGGVYEATQLSLGRKVALKHLYPRYAGNEKAFVRFRQEAMSAASIGHDNICEVTDLGIGLEGAPYLVMPLLKGLTVHEMIRSEGSLKPGRVVDLGCQILSGLGAAHRAGILHRDLKPANVFVTRLGDRGDFVKLLDFGVSKVISGAERTDLTRTGEVVGTPHYMAPEQAKGVRNLDQRLDLYAVGVILYEMLTRRRPFDGDSYNEVMYKILTERFPAPSVVNPLVPAGMERVVITAMAREPRDRYADAAAMREDLRRAGDASPLGVETSAPTAILPAASGDPPPRRRPPSTPASDKQAVAASLDSIYNLRPRMGTPVSTGAVAARPIPSRESRYARESWITYRGKEILLRDYSHLDPAASRRVIESSLLSTHDLVLEGRRGLLVMTDMTEWYADKEIMEKVKKIAALIRPCTARFAAVGVKGIQTVLISAMVRTSGLDIKLFDTRDEALEWLTE
jgi:serine/threonine-protein kinase